MSGLYYLLAFGCAKVRRIGLLSELWLAVSGKAWLDGRQRRGGVRLPLLLF